MDGNGRWAKAQGLDRSEGHRRGMEVAYETANSCRKLAIPFLTLFAFSTENWRRPDSEVKELIKLFDDGLRENLNKILKDNIKFRFIGDLSLFPKTVRTAIDKIEKATKDNKSLTLQIALNYSGRWDIVEAIRKLADTGHDISMLSEEDLSKNLTTTNIPEPDLVIRTSGELRLSNFMLWQAAYSELYFTDCLWPEFDEEALSKAISSFANRERRFGAVENNS